MTSLLNISDSSPESKDGTLRVLDYFADLYIWTKNNYKKAKMIVHVVLGLE